MRTKRNMIALLSLMLCLVLTAVSVLAMTGCKKQDPETPKTTDAPADQNAAIEKGTGAKSFVFKVTFKSGESKTYNIHTDKTVVGDALVELGIISGTDSAYGLYVDTVDGEKLVYETDNMYWAFYIGSDYAMTGVDGTNIEEGQTYAFVATKG